MSSTAGQQSFKHVAQPYNSNKTCSHKMPPGRVVTRFASNLKSRTIVTNPPESHAVPTTCSNYGLSLASTSVFKSSWFHGPRGDDVDKRPFPTMCTEKQ